MLTVDGAVVFPLLWGLSPSVRIGPSPLAASSDATCVISVVFHILSNE